jgi:hypothetical protein
MNIAPLNDARDKNFKGALEILDRYYLDKHLTGKEVVDQPLNLPKMGSSTDSMTIRYNASIKIRKVS